MRSPADTRRADRLGAERLTDAEIDRSIDAALSERDGTQPFWVFAYGSLMWNPGFAYVAKRVGTVYGFHRSFRQWSRINRGTPERPGLVLTLERGGSCRGLAYRLGSATTRADLAKLWRREMMLRSYEPRWLVCHAGAERMPVLAFVVNRGCAGYAGDLGVEAVVQALATARGKAGSAAEYLFHTQAVLEVHGIRDERIRRLAERVRHFLSREPAAPA
jgi:glutathione-specific gamma-glutamylcyclotransferase